MSVARIVAVIASREDDVVKLLPQMVVVGTTIFVYLILKHIDVGQPHDFTRMTLIAMLITGLGCDVKVCTQSRCWRLAYYGVVGLFVFYIATSYFSLPLDNLLREHGEWAELGVRQGKWYALVFGVLAFWRVGFAAFPLLYVAWLKNVTAEQVGFPISSTDYLTVLEFGLLLVLGALVARRLPAVFTMLPTDQQTEQRAGLERDYWSYSQMLVFACLAMHFGNYFYSAIAKLELAPNWTAWVLQNDTHFIMMSAEVAKVLPITVNDQLLKFGHWAVNTFVVPNNALTLLAQLLSILALRKISWAIGVTVLYDLMHVTIFLVSGIFFWKWVILNVAIVAALASTRWKQISWSLYLFGTAMLLLGPYGFSIARLGWYDTPSSTKTYFEAVTRDGRVVEVPSNYFLMASITVAQQRLGKSRNAAPFPGHFPVHSLGAVFDPDLKALGEQCALPVQPGTRLESAPQSAILATFLQRHHAYVLDHIDKAGRFNYDLYPHHIWSNPLMYKNFAMLDKREIVLYRYNVESTCAVLDGHRLQTEILNRSSYDISVH